MSTKKTSVKGEPLKLKLDDYKGKPKPKKGGVYKRNNNGSLSESKPEKSESGKEGETNG